MSSPDKVARHEIQAGKISPIVNRASSQQSHEKSSKRLFTWATVNFMIAFAFVYEWYSRQVQCWFDIDSFVIEVLLLAGAVLFFLNSLVDFIRAANSSLTLNSVVLSPVQTKLMGLKRIDPSYKSPSASPKLPRTSSTFSQDNFNLLNLTLYHSTPTTTFQARRSPSLSPTSSFHTTQASPVVDSFICGESYLSKSATLEGSGYLDSSGASPCVRHRRSPFMKGPLSPNDFMTDRKSLSNYLKSQFETSQAKMQLYGYESSPGTNPSCFGPTSMHVNDPALDLGKNVYQLSTRSPKSPTRSKESKDAVAKIAALEYWQKAKVNEDCLKEWVARLRRWISLTILRGIVKEVDSINSKLKQLGCSEIQVGESSLHSLKQIQVSKGAQIPSLSWLLPYLEVTTHQEYLVERVRNLATGYMSEFCWDKGGKMKGRREWGDDLITDCELIMHFLCVYMDLHLPANPRYPDGKTFSAQYFVQTPDKPKAGGDLIIYQTTLHPPHYQLVTKETTYDLPSGRHNMFCAILLFIHHIKTKEGSMLGQVNLGLSGINILHVIEPVNNLYSDVTSPQRG